MQIAPQRVPHPVRAQLFNGPYALAVAAGMAATVNPCGFALPPANLSAFLGSEHRAGGANAVARALAVSAVVSSRSSSVMNASEGCA